MTVRSTLPGFVVGTLGLVAGGLAIALSEPALGAVAGALALAAGTSALQLARRLETQSVAGSLMADELKWARSRVLEAEAEVATANEAAAAATEASASRGPEPKPEAATSPERAGPVPDPEPTIIPGPDDPAVINQMAADHPTNSALVDQTTGLFSENFFLVALDSRIAAARRHLRPVAMVLLEVVRGMPTGDPRPVDANTVADTIKTTLREADTACRLHNGYFALLLEDTPENGAIWTVERIRRQLLEGEEGLTVWAGVACYPAHAFSPEQLMKASEQALVAARDWRQDRIEVAAVAD